MKKGDKNISEDQIFDNPKLQKSYIELKNEIKKNKFDIMKFFV